MITPEQVQALRQLPVGPIEVSDIAQQFDLEEDDAIVLLIEAYIYVPYVVGKRWSVLHNCGHILVEDHTLKPSRHAHMSTTCEGCGKKIRLKAIDLDFIFWRMDFE